jgi:hypothetical protein
MNIQKLFLPILLLAALATGCAKSTPRIEITQADLETTNAAVNAAMRRFVARSGSNIRIDGTANMIHTRWEVESSLIGGYIEVGPGFPTEPGQAASPGKVPAHAETFVIVRSLKSMEDGKSYSERMDEVMYDHLRATNGPKDRITFHLAELSLKEPAKSPTAPYIFEAKGQVAIAGVTNVISIPVNLTPLGSNRLKFEGSFATKITDFKIAPPAPKPLPLVTGDEVKLTFQWIVEERPATNAPPPSAPVSPAAK